MLYGYVRVSTNKQTVENQKLSIIHYAKTKNLPEQITWVSETESGTKSYKSRLLGGLIEQQHKGDILLVSELSRLVPGRVHQLMKFSITAFFLKSAFLLLANSLL